MRWIPLFALLAACPAEVDPLTEAWVGAWDVTDHRVEAEGCEGEGLVEDPPAPYLYTVVAPWGDQMLGGVHLCETSEACEAAPWVQVELAVTELGRIEGEDYHYVYLPTEDGGVCDVFWTGLVASQQDGELLLELRSAVLKGIEVPDTDACAEEAAAAGESGACDTMTTLRGAWVDG